MARPTVWPALVNPSRRVRVVTQQTPTMTDPACKGIRTMKTLVALAWLSGLVAAPAFAADPPARVMLVATFHFNNPGKDLNNTKAVDMLTPVRQAELQAVADGLSGFSPTVVAIEWRAPSARDAYAAYLKGAPASRNEGEQLGFRLARKMGLPQVYGIDVDGSFPFEPLATWANDNGMAGRLTESQNAMAALIESLTERQQTHSIGGVLKWINSPTFLRQANAFYGDALRYGRADTQPGAALNAAWAERNYGICARLAQVLKPGDRAVVFYGLGHVSFLRHCIQDIPGLELVDPAAYLPD